MGRLYHTLIILLFSHLAMGQLGNFRSLGSGSWGTPGTWERDADSNGSFEESPSTVAPTNASGTIAIRSSHNVTVAAIVTVDQTTIESGGILTINSGITLTLANGSGDDVTINSGGSVVNNGTIQMVAGIGGNNIRFRIHGDLNNNGAILNSSTAKLIFESGADYFHLFDGTSANTIPIASWNLTSTVNITGFGSGGTNVPNGLTQQFGNFIWNTPSMDQFIDLGGAPAIVNGNFQIDDTGLGGFYWNQGGGANTTFSVGGNLLVNGGLWGFVGQVNGTLNVTGDVILTGGYLQIAEDFDATINITDDLSISGSAILDFSAVSAIVDVNLVGDYSYTAGDIYVTAGSGNLNFVGVSATQSVTSTVAPVGSVNYFIDALAVVNVPGSNFFGGSGDFTVEGTLQVGSTHGSGALQTGTSNGNVRVSGARTYVSNSTIVYNGSAAQFIGNGQPTTTGINTTINNSSGVSLIVGVPIIITTNLTLLSGNLNIGNGALTLNGTLTPNSNNITIGTNGSLTISGSSTVGTFPFPSGAQTFSAMTLDNSNGVTFNNDVTINGALTLTSGSLSFPGRSLTLNGTFAGTGSGDLSPSNTSTLVVGGSGAFGTLRINNTNNTIGTLTMNRSSSGTAAINTSLIITSAFNLTNGNFTNSGGLQMANGSTLIRNSNAQLLGNPPTDLTAGEFYNITYTGGALSTGLELPTIGTDNLGTLTINGGPVTLGSSIYVNRDVVLQNSTLVASTFNINLRGTSRIWNKQSGSFTGGTGSVIVDGSYTISASSTPNFTNLTVNASASLTMPSGNCNIAGNLQVNASSTFNANNGTIIMNGSGNQNLAAGGKTVRNITINKSAGSVTISNAVNITGILDVQSATSVSSGGNLTLISNASGTATIASLNAGGSITGNVITQRFVAGTGRDFRDISAPVLNPTVAQLISSGITITGNFTGTSFPCSGCATNNASFFFYDESVAGAQTLGYTAHPPNGGNSTTSTLATGRGYSLLVRNEVGSPTISLTGTINSGNLSLPVSFTSTVGGTSEDGWNLVGNPYPGHIDWDVIAGWTKTNIQGNQISVWDPNKGGSGGYRVWNGSTGDLGNGRIALGQGFWVKASSASPVLQINESAKTTTSTSFYRTNEKVESLELVVKNLDSGSEDNAFLQIQEGAKSGIDSFDGFKKMSPVHNLTTLGEQHIPLSINVFSELPDEELIPLKLSEVEVGEFEISVNALGDIFSSVPVYLFDKQLYTEVELNKGSYFFKATESDLTELEARFYIYFNEKARVGEPGTGIQLYPIPVNDQLNVVVNDPSIEPQMTLLDNMGRTSMNFELPHNNGVRRGSIDVSQLPTGLYFIKGIKSGSSVVVKFLKQ